MKRKVVAVVAADRAVQLTQAATAARLAAGRVAVERRSAEQHRVRAVSAAQARAS